MKIRISKDIVEIGNVIFVMRFLDWFALAVFIITAIFICLTF